MKQWHVWTIDQNRYRRIREFIDGMPEIELCLYPLINKDYKVKGVIKVKEVPLFSNYIFLLYDHSPKTLTMLSSCPWIKTYVGVCPPEEIESVKELSKRKYEDIIPTEKIIMGHNYKLSGTPFRGLTCTVVDIDGPKLTVAVGLFGMEKYIKCSVDDVELER